MIKTIADLLAQLAVAEARQLDANDIRHPGVIGEMYEGLTRALLNQVIPDTLRLQIVKGFVTDGSGGMSGQIDCMLVRGEGTAVPYVDNTYQWHVKDVIAVFEVKKELFGGDLSDAFVHLDSVLEANITWLTDERNEGFLNIRPTRRAYAQIVGEMAPAAAEWERMPTNRHMILHTIISDQIAPIRIILGYGGYSTEYGLRKGFVDYLNAHLNEPGFGPPHIPNLIVAGASSLVKLTGHPYLARLSDEGDWPLVASSSANPILFVLELIWTRLSYTYDLTDLFGEDLETESLAPLLDVRPMQAAGNFAKWGWAYSTNEWSKEQLAGLAARQPWEPVELNEVQFFVVNELCRHDIDIDESSFRTFIESKGLSVDEVVGALQSTSLVALDGRTLMLTTTECGCVLLPDGRRVAAENSTGRLSRWVARYSKERQ